MSAPHPGRQSPEPANQTGAQQQAPPAKNSNNQGAADSPDQPAEQSKEQLKNLESNPKHILKNASDAKAK